MNFVWMFGIVTGFALGGCETPFRHDAPTPTEAILRVTNHVGGTHYRMIIRDDLWYQTFSNNLLVLDSRTAQPNATIELATFGECGPAVDMAVANDELYIVLEDDQVLRLSLSDPQRPEIIDRQSAADLGILPRRLSVVMRDGHEVVYVCGRSGAVRFSGGPVLFEGKGDVRSIAVAEMGLVGTIGRRVYRADDETYVGAASDLMALPDTDSGTLLFAQHSTTGSLVGLMGADVRERNARTFTTAVGGTVRRVRYFDGSIWIVTDEQILAYTPTDNELKLREVFPVRGAFDVDKISENYLAVAGTFGRSIYRIRDDSNGSGDTFIMAERAPGLLRYAVSDRLQILAGTPEQGTWLYQIGSQATLLEKVLAQEPPISREAVIDDGTATISDDSSDVVLRKGKTTIRWQHPKEYPLYCVIAVEGRLWIGHERGLVILEVNPPSPEDVNAAMENELPVPDPSFSVKGEVWLHGPVRYLFALLTNRGAAYVAMYGGFGTVELIDVPIETPEL